MRPPADLLSRVNDATRTSATPSGLGTLARGATAVWLAVSAVNLVVWLLICVIGGSFDSPWWLWAFLGGGAVVAGLHIAARSYRPGAGSPGSASPGTADDDGDVW